MSNVLAFPENELSFLLKGPVGQIEVLTTHPVEQASKNATVIICHPHPLFGGTMHNKVVTTMARAFHDMGMKTIRFNFRGVGRTAGSHDEGRGETQDVLAILEWVKQVCPNDNIDLAGFSFGGFVAANTVSEFALLQDKNKMPINNKQNFIKQLITIAPQVSNIKKISIDKIDCPWLIIQGDLDDVVSPEELYAWVHTLPNKPKVIRMSNAGHFFHGQLTQLKKILIENLN